MAATKGSGKLNLGAMIQAHAQDQTDYGQDFSALPPGISGGVAKFVEGKIGTYKTGDNQGEKFVYLAGVVVEPVEHTWVPKVFDATANKVVNLPAMTRRVEGGRTS